MQNYLKKSANRVKGFYSCLRAGEKAYNYPEVILVELTNRCNLNCGICVKQRIAKRDNADMPFETFKSITQKFLPFLSKITFAGFGEPLLNKEIFKIINYAHIKGVRTSLITNGTLLSEQISRQFIDSGLDKISISLDTIDEKKYKRFRGWELQRVLMNIARLKELKEKTKDKRNILDILINYTLTTENIEEVPEMVKLGYALGVDGVDFGPADEIDLDFQENSLLNYDKNKLDYIFKEGIKADRNKISNLKLFREGLMSPSLYDIPGQKSCYSPWGYMLIMADGEVMPCCRPFNYYLGKLNGNNFQEIWNGSKYRDFRRKLISGNYCNKCMLNTKLNNLKIYMLIRNLCKWLPPIKKISKRKFQH